MVMTEQTKKKSKAPDNTIATISPIYVADNDPKTFRNGARIFIYQSRTFHRNIKIFLTLIQTFALMPVYGVGALTAHELKFSLCSLRIMYSCGILTFGLTHAAVVLHYNYTTGFSFDKMSPVIWFTINPFAMYQFIRLAAKWPNLMRHWETFEIISARQDDKVQRQMQRIITATSIGIPILALIEHLLSLANNLIKAQLCKTETSVMASYFRAAFPAYFHIFETNYVNGIAVQMLNFYCTFTWSMTDTFIILVSLGLVTQFRNYNKHFDSFKGMHLPPEFWSRQRVYFTKLTELLDQVNKDLAVLIVTSYITNTFYICLQLFESIMPSNSLIRGIYFWFSLIYLIGKTILVSVVATIINDEAKKPIQVLECIPGTVYDSEAARFMHQLTSGTIALSGMQFFYITRRFLISMAGTIMTYEILLLQLHTRKEAVFDPCEV